MFDLFDKVRILKNGIVGTIVDISPVDGSTQYIVESDTPNVSGGYGGKWKLFDCFAEELQRLDLTKKASGNDRR